MYSLTIGFSLNLSVLRYRYFIIGNINCSSNGTKCGVNILHFVKETLLCGALGKRVPYRLAFWAGPACPVPTCVQSDLFNAVSCHLTQQLIVWIYVVHMQCRA